MSPSFAIKPLIPNKTTNNTNMVLKETEHNVQSSTYRWAILSTMAALHDYQSRSKVDAIRRGAMTIFEEKGFLWQDPVFWQTMKTMNTDGDISLHSYSIAEISPALKKKIVDYAMDRLEIDDPNEEVMRDS